MDVNQRLGQVCPNILCLVDLVLTIPASSTDADRGFSYMKNTKTDNRSRLLQAHLTDQMTVILEFADVKSYDPMPAITLWNTHTIRRIKTITAKDQRTGRKTL